MKSYLLAMWISLTLLPVAVQAQTRLIGRPDLAVKAAAQDATAISQIDPDMAVNLFYIWIRDPQDAEMDNMYDFVLNMGLSRATVLLRADRIIGPHGILLRIDKRAWLPEKDQRLAFDRLMADYCDPTFYVEAGNTLGGVADVSVIDIPEAAILNLFREQHPNLVFKAVVQREPDQNRVKVSTEPFNKDGKIYTAAYVICPEDDAPVASGIIFGPVMQAVANAEIKQLTTITGMTVPIVEAERFMVKSLTQLEGGFYYQLQGLITPDGTRLKQEDWLKTFGADEQTSDDLGGREYVAMWQSEVTGKPRRISYFFGTNVRPSAGTPLISVTQDNLDETNQVDLHPMYSLLESEFDATEILATRPNGMIAYALYDGKGNLQDQAPDNLVHDHTIPEPYTSRLEPAISCIRCHGPQDQWKPVKNHAQDLLKGLNQNGQRIFAIGDNAAPDLSDAELEVRLATLYSGNVEAAMQLARDRFELACGKLTNRKTETADQAKWMAETLAKRYAAYRYSKVDPQEALRTLGVFTSKEESHDVLEQILPANPEGNTPRLTDIALFSLRLNRQDPDISLIREDWERVYQPTLAYAVQYGKFPTPTEAVPQNPNVENPPNVQSKPVPNTESGGVPPAQPPAQ